jgi:UDP-N-acetylglucosamine diphosphorylase/glucosamine-1-phosphate N-acetyltransferase
MNIVLFDTLQARELLKPFSYTRALAKIRIGIVTIEEKWKRYLTGDYSFLTAPYLSDKFPCVEAQENLCINSTVCPDQVLVEAIKSLKANQKLVKGNILIATRCGRGLFQDLQRDDFDTPDLKSIPFEGTLTQITNNWDIFLLNEQELRKDFQWICEGRTTQPIQDQHTIIYNEQSIFLEEGVSVKAAILNAASGPIYIGSNATIQEGSVIRGPAVICEAVQINSGARITNATTIGPYSKVGGEVSNSVILGYSNKAHDGFMGNSVIGEWCNLGAGANTSNLKNDYGKVKIWDERREEFDTTDLQFCGLFMGDHTTCAINTMFNTGTIVGISSNLFGVGFFDKVIPSFTWGMPDNRIKTYRLDKALEAAECMSMRRLMPLTKQDKEILAHVFLTTAIYRS